MSWIPRHSPPSLPSAQGVAQAAVDTWMIGAPLVSGNVPGAIAAATEQFGRSVLRDRGYDPETIEQLLRGNAAGVVRRILYRYGEDAARQYILNRVNALQRIRAAGRLSPAFSIASRYNDRINQNPFARRLREAVFGGNYKRPRDDPSSSPNGGPHSRSGVDPISSVNNRVWSKRSRVLKGVKRPKMAFRSSRKRRFAGRTRKYGRKRSSRSGVRHGKSRYTVWKSLMSGKQVPGMKPRYAPKFSKSHKDGSITIRNREWITDIGPAGSTFAVYPYINLNPGNGGLGSWAASLAANFQMYSFKKLKFEYVTASGYVSTTSGSLGQIMMAINYNTDEAAFTSKQALLQSRSCAAGVPSSNLTLVLDRKHLAQKEFYVNNTSRHPLTGAPIDGKTYEPGTFQFATNSTATGALLGELFVEYTITLSKPTASWWKAGGACHYRLNSVTNALPLGSAGPTLIFDDWAANQTNYIASNTQLTTVGPSNWYTTNTGNYGAGVSGTFITIPITPGATGYQLYYQVVGTSTALVNPSWTYTNATVGVGPSAGNDFAGSAGAWDNGGTTSTVYFKIANLTVTDPSKAVTITIGAAGTLPASATSADLWINPLSANAN